MLKDVFLLGSNRTAIGSFGGALAAVPAPKLGSVTIRAALERAGVEPGAVDEVIFGNVLSAGLGQNVARQAGLEVLALDAANVDALTRQDCCIDHRAMAPVADERFATVCRR